jgi:hypothetical protein
LTNVTAWPTATVTVAGFTPAAVIVTVAALGPVPPSRTMTVVPPPPGDVGELPPQEAIAPSATIVTMAERMAARVFDMVESSSEKLP